MKKYKDYDKYLYNLFLGIIPWGLSEAYPVFQHEEPSIIDDERLVYKLVEDTCNYIIAKSYVNVVLVISSIDWVNVFSRELANKLEKMGVRVSYIYI